MVADRIAAVHPARSEGVGQVEGLAVVAPAVGEQVHPPVGGTGRPLQARALQAMGQTERVPLAAHELEIPWSLAERVALGQG